jgi:ferredoxin-like protein FixX
MEAGTRPKLVDEILKCALEANVNNNLQYLLKPNMELPNTMILRQAMNAAIHSGSELKNNKYFEFAETLAKLIYIISPLNEDQIKAQWTIITTGDITARIALENKNSWSWEKYFDFDIKRRKKLDAAERHEAMKTLYNAKILSLFRAKHYLKVLFTLVKLGADPFEMKQSKSKSYSTSLTCAIIKSKKLSKEKRLHLLHHLSEKKLLRADKCGPTNTSPVITCLTSSTRRSEFRYLVGAGGIENLLENGNNIMQLLSAKHKVDILLPHLSVEQFKKMLAQPNKSFATLYTLHKPTSTSQCETFATAVKELLIENPSIRVEKLVHLFPVEFLAQYSKDPSVLTAAKAEYYKNVEPVRSRSTEKFNGNTVFHFEHLPLEISEMICSYLPAHDRTKLLAVNKTMKNMQLSFGEYFWRSMLKTAFPVVHAHLEDTTRNWYEKTLSVTRSVENWRNGIFSKKILTFKTVQPSYISSLTFDEYWLSTGVGANLMFWNCVDDSIRYYGMPFAPLCLRYLNSTPDNLPNFVASSNEKLYCHINGSSNTFSMPNLDINRKMGFYQFLAPLSQKQFIVGGGVFDIELETIVAKLPNVDVFTGKKQIVGDNIICATLKNIVIYDKDLREVSNSRAFPSQNHLELSMDILDENLIHIYAPDFNTVTDLRTMKVLHSCPAKIYNNSNGAYRTIFSEKGVGTVWNLKNNTWESSFPLPNGTHENPICNSRYAVFSSVLHPKFSKLGVLDFDSITK